MLMKMPEIHEALARGVNILASASDGTVEGVTKLQNKLAISFEISVMKDLVASGKHLEVVDFLAGIAMNKDSQLAMQAFTETAITFGLGMAGYLGTSKDAWEQFLSMLGAKEGKDA